MKIVGQGLYKIDQEVRLTDDHINCTHIGTIKEIRIKRRRGLGIIQYKVHFPTIGKGQPCITQSCWFREKDLVSNTKFNYIALLFKKLERWMTK